ncbi:hypothetical protein Golob_005692 [Gossypium lobatum]|uniref:RNase H type-1 domain-containing protein n=1 Tax=Gossypium lobatum TaxID=34289 RepID=A0A7J8MU14_9ROSI|nr:hypothetical protein [Gossypium lobatum]
MCEAYGHITEDVLYATRDCSANEHDLGFGEADWKSFLGSSYGAYGKIAISLFFKGHLGIVLTLFRSPKQFMMTARGLTRPIQAPSSCSNLHGIWVYLNADGSCLVFKAELWGILDDLDILIDRGYDNVLVQTNSFEVANVVKKGLTGRSNSALIRKILQLFSRLQL